MTNWLLWIGRPRAGSCAERLWSQARSSFLPRSVGSPPSAALQQLVKAGEIIASMLLSWRNFIFHQDRTADLRTANAEGGLVPSRRTSAPVTEEAEAVGEGVREGRRKTGVRNTPTR